MLPIRLFLTLQFCTLIPIAIGTAFLISQSCDCDQNKIAFTQAYIESHQLIFRGKTVSTGKGEDYAKAVFSVSQLFKGSAPKEITVYFDMKSECSLKMNVGEDWLIYANHKQLQKPYVEYCSRSRKNVVNTSKNVDLLYIKSDMSVDAESEQLQEKLGLQRFAAQAASDNRHSNIIPGFWQRVALIVASIVGFLLIYLALSRFLKK